MGFFKKIGSRLKKAKHLGQRISHGASIGLRKFGNTANRVSDITGKVAGYLNAIPNPIAQSAGKLLGTASDVGSSVGKISKMGSKTLKQVSEGDFKNALESAKQTKKEVGNFR